MVLAHWADVACPLSSRWHRMVSTPQLRAPDILHLVHSRIGPVCNLSQPQTDGICVSSSRLSGSSSGCLGQVVSVCLSPKCTNATSASQVGALTPVSNATGCSPSALPAVASNAAQVASRLSSRETSITMAPGAASVRGIP